MTHWDFSANTRTEKHKPKRSGVEKGAESMVSQDRASRDKAMGAAQGTYSQFEGPVGQSPYYKSLVASSTDATSNAYENAKASSARRAREAGFGYGTPIGEAASRETEGAEAGALARIPAESYAATAPLALEAARGSADIGKTYGTEATETETGAVVPLEQEYLKRSDAFSKRLWDMGLSGIEAATKV